LFPYPSLFRSFRRVAHATCLATSLRAIRDAVSLHALLQLACLLKISARLVFVIGLAEDASQGKVRFANEIVRARVIRTIESNRLAQILLGGFGMPLIVCVQAKVNPRL